MSSKTLKKWYKRQNTVTNSQRTFVSALEAGVKSSTRAKLLQPTYKMGTMDTSDITESVLDQHMLTCDHPDPDLIIRTSGEYRLSNFLLWQLAYSEMFFLDKQWPETTKNGLIQVIRNYATQRKRRFGK